MKRGFLKITGRKKRSDHHGGVHVFGVTAQWVLQDYPWYSADSTTAVLAASMGHVRRWNRAKGAIDQMHWLPRRRPAVGQCIGTTRTTPSLKRPPP